MSRTNCYFFTMRQWFTRGGYILIRRSDFGWWPHIFWSPDLITREDYVPLTAKYVRAFPPPIFVGVVHVEPLSEDRPPPHPETDDYRWTSRVAVIVALLVWSTCVVLCNLWDRTIKLLKTYLTPSS